MRRELIGMDWSAILAICCLIVTLRLSRNENIFLKFNTTHVVADSKLWIETIDSKNVLCSYLSSESSFARAASLPLIASRRSCDLLLSTDLFSFSRDVWGSMGRFCHHKSAFLSFFAIT
jgi:hypothetical protein